MEFDLNDRNYFRVSLRVEVNFNEDFSGISKDISMNGLCLVSNQELQIGNYIKLAIHLPEAGLIKPVGKIKWIKKEGDEYFTGIEFWELSPNDKDLLQNSLEEIIQTGDLESRNKNIINTVDYKLNEIQFVIKKIDDEVSKPSLKVTDNVKTAGREDYWLNIQISDDKMRISADCSRSDTDFNIIKSKIDDFVEQNQIVVPVLWENIHRFFAESKKTKNDSTQVIVTQGVQPVSEIPQHIEIKAEILSKLNSTMPAGKNAREGNFHKFIIVNTDEVIAQIIPKVEGRPGQRVVGTPTPFTVKNVKEIRIGMNCKVDKNGSIKAACTGRLNYESDEIYISKCLVIDGDINKSAAQVKFPGDIYVTGNILEGGGIVCGGELFCDGDIEVTAEMFVQKNLVCAGGLTGRKHHVLRVGGNLYVRSIQGCYIEVRGNIFVEKNIRKSNINTLNGVELGESGEILGSKICAYNYVKCFQLGALGKEKSIISLGINFLASKRMLRVNAKQKKLNETLKDVKKHEKAGDRDYENYEKEIEKGLAELDSLAGKLLGILYNNDNPALEVYGHARPLFLVQICNAGMEYTSEMQNCRFTLDRIHGSVMVAKP